MRVISPAFSNGATIPERYTCAGINVNPSLFLEDIPSTAKTLVLIVEDTDSTYGYWINWLVYNIPVISHIREDSIPGKQGTNSYNRRTYGGPASSEETHRYMFTAYALDTVLSLPEGASVDELLDAIREHVLDKAQLLGTFCDPKHTLEKVYTH
jgi:Raf kinase inhibitor-like YbhB/YbcL family protein